MIMNVVEEFTYLCLANALMLLVYSKFPSSRPFSSVTKRCVYFSLHQFIVTLNEGLRQHILKTWYTFYMLILFMKFKFSRLLFLLKGLRCLKGFMMNEFSTTTDKGDHYKLPNTSHKLFTMKTEKWHFSFI